MITVDSNPFLDTTPNFRGARYEMPEPVDPTAPKMTAGNSKRLHTAMRCRKMSKI